jgi:heterodisulfide reductase subunit C
MPGNLPPNPGPDQTEGAVSLRKMVKEKIGQDVIRCLGCGVCNTHQHHEEMDVSVDSLVQMILEDDEDVLSTRTLWSDTVLESMRNNCKRGLNLRYILLSLRSEAQSRGLTRSCL